MTQPIIEISNLERRFQLPRESLFRPASTVYALNGINLTVEPQRSFGIVGESGCGKSTLARIIMGLDKPSSGTVKVKGKDITAISPAELREMRSDFQMVFQDPFGSLNPRHHVERIVAEPLYAVGDAIGKQERKEKVAEALTSVGLRPTDMEKYPHEFSGGQRQRVAIARALITRPSLIVADEPVSALDVSVQAQVLNLLRDLEDQFGITFVFISHNLAVVDYACQDAAVIYLGRIVEQGPTSQLFNNPLHPYTQSLVDAVPHVGVKNRRAARQAPTALKTQTAAQTGCTFAGRCSFAKERCRTQQPTLRVVDGGHSVACHFFEETRSERASMQTAVAV
ncbi:peptide ABC transporter ATP-binding protein [Mesorhizobium sp. Root552]|jgi:peptide/nickel transport system ATP-binding protein|uniref:ABC transporter ATP-binding protein n=1 Tax=Mesorhizobium sp. Root552 TaxID=1736555 RepID=UPI0006FCA3A9|nr:oligopeptide/dipeptide ABC transporter ATP-binding protein [Mesorhizobium sp. Root552]KQZ31847.1 peptide ABC transporter ATP-binding protein [Mesorhizobium sp. Root552]